MYEVGVPPPPKKVCWAQILPDGDESITDYWRVGSRYKCPQICQVSKSIYNVLLACYQEYAKVKVYYTLCGH